MRVIPMRGSQLPLGRRLPCATPAANAPNALNAPLCTLMQVQMHRPAWCDLSSTARWPSTRPPYGLPVSINAIVGSHSAARYENADSFPIRAIAQRELERGKVIESMGAG